MKRRVRFVTGKSVPYGASKKVRTGRRKAGPTCACGRKFEISRKSPIPPHKNLKTGQWCNYVTQSGKRTKAETSGVRTAASRAKVRAKPAVTDVAVSRKGQLRCASCLVWFDAPTGEITPHRDRLNRRACPGSRNAGREAPQSKVGKRAAPKSQSQHETAQAKRRRESPRLQPTPEERHERAIERKRADRIELQMIEIAERPPRDDIEFGPGRDPRIYGGLSETRRSRY